MRGDQKRFPSQHTIIVHFNFSRFLHTLAIFSPITSFFGHGRAIVKYLFLVKEQNEDKNCNLEIMVYMIGKLYCGWISLFWLSSQFTRSNCANHSYSKKSKEKDFTYLPLLIFFFFKSKVWKPMKLQCCFLYSFKILKSLI